MTGFLLAAAGAALTACGGGGGGGGGGDGAPPPVMVSGVVTFDYVPSVPGTGIGAGLDYGATMARPARGVTVEFVDGATVVGATRTDADGAWSLSLPASRTGMLRAKAEMAMSGTAGWHLTVVDNTNADALYAIEGASFSTGTAASRRDLHAASGWTGAGYGAPRAAAPFAILDALADGLDLLVSADPGLSLPPLVVYWSPANIPSPTENGFDPATGEIVTTFYSAEFGGLFVLGAEDADTDEYDRHVLLHEWAHYLEAAISRSDSIGGLHAPGDVLDMRVAFGEGWGNAFAALATGEPVFRDVIGPGQREAPAFDVETPMVPNPASGWYSEQSVHELLWDLVDQEPDGADALSLGFDALHAVVTGSYQEAVPLTSVFSFIAGLKQANPVAAPLIDALVDSQSIKPIADAWGTGETNDAGASFGEDVLPVYRQLIVGGPAVNICSTDEFASAATGLTNKLGSRRLISFDVPVAGNYAISVITTSVPAGAFADPDFIVHRGRDLIGAEQFATPVCEAVGDPGWQPAYCHEHVTAALAAGEHVLEVYEYTNTLGSADAIGRTCFDVMVGAP